MTRDEALNYCDKTNCCNCVVKLYNLDVINKDNSLCYENLITIYQENKRFKRRIRRKKDNEFNKNRKDS